MKRQRKAAVLLSLFIFFGLVSAFFLLYEADHHCNEEQCPICHIIYEIKGFLTKLAGKADVRAFARFIAGMALIINLSAVIFNDITPVDLKVKLTN